MPVRIQRQRTKGWRKPPNTVIVDRTSRWGNPYMVRPIGMTEWVVYEWDEMIGEKTRSRAKALAECLDWYRKWAEVNLAIEPDWLAPLVGKNLCCWCKEGDACHADVLLALCAELEQEPA